MTAETAREIRTFSGLEELSRAAASEIVRIARESISQRGRFSIALSGGNTPKRTYQLLVDAHSDEIHWSRTDVFFGDERFVPPDDPRSNYKMAREALLDRAPISSEHVYPIPTNTATVDDAALAYEATLKRAGSSPNAGFTLDLVLLGIGPDGHTASLFPGVPAVGETTRWTRAVDAPTEVQPAVPRVTVTLPFLNAARNVVFLIAGADKRRVIGEILSGAESGRRYPAAMVAPRSGPAVWMVEQAAMPATTPNA
jgi:6-phosphogluconolactonase